MFRSLQFALLGVFLIVALCDNAIAQRRGRQPAPPAEEAQWVWFDEGDPLSSAPAGKVWFRQEFKADEPSTGAVSVACDDEFVIWVNGQKVGEGTGNKAYRFNLSGIVGRGTNVFAIEASNKEGKAGVCVDGQIRSQGGRSIPARSNGEWLASRTAPKGDNWLKPRFEDATWKPVKVLGPHGTSPWKEIAFTSGEMDRFQVPPGFELRRVAGPELVGSLVCMTWGNDGRLLVSRERGPILCVTDVDGDGMYETASEYTSQVKNCQGLCMVHDDLYAVGDGPQKTGMYRLPDRDHDGKADEVVLVTNYKGGIGEHGPHDVVFGPDGWLYHNLGNHAWITHEPEATTPCRNFEEGNLLEPAFEDAGGHAVGIKAPGGTIWRFTPDGKKWWMEANGFRNHYDIAFNSQGDLFTFDSDMEWDVNLPWYRPIRVNHCIPGAEFGWRSGAKCWPDYYFDSLPGTINIGRGSPTGIVFYEHSQFPEKYRGSLLLCDWSMGRILVGFLQPQGATYTGTFENLVTGNPLNVSDIEVDRDGSVLFCTGGRNTEGGLYRLTYIGDPHRVGSVSDGPPRTPKSPPAETLTDAFAMPQLQSAWAREAISKIKSKLVDRWEPELTAKVKSGTPAEKIRALTFLTQFGPKPPQDLLIATAGDTDAAVRAFATLLLGDHPTPEVATKLSQLLQDKSSIVQRRACEAFVRSGLEAPVEPIVKLLSHNDRWLRFAARLALERLPVTRWKEAIVTATRFDVYCNGMLALLRLKEISPDEVLGNSNNARNVDDISREQFLLYMVRLEELRLIAGGKRRLRDGDETLTFGTYFEGTRSPEGESFRSAVAELAKLVAGVQDASGPSGLVKALELEKNSEQQIQFALCLSYLKTGWTIDLKKRYLDWYNKTADWEGGNSLQGYLRNIVTAALERYTPDERKQLLLTWKERPHATRLLVANSTPQQVTDYDAVIAKLLAEVETQPGSQELVSLTIDALAKSDKPESQTSLRKLFDENADRRDQLARSLAKHPTSENVPYLLRSLRGSDNTTLQICLQALLTSEYRPDKPAEIRAVILAGLKLGEQGGTVAANVLQKWTDSKRPEGNAAAALAHYQQWYREKYPQEPLPELAKEDTQKSKYSFQQLVDFLDNNPQGKAGDVERGKQVFAKANCIKCHRFLKEGEGVGPDLTSLRRRFQRKEIIESLLLPSQVISDQFAAVTVVTTDGLVHTGLPLPNPASNNMLLLLQDATKLEIPKNKIEEQARAKVSVMPEGLLKDLSLQDIADLFAFLETSKNNPEPVAVK